MNFAFDVSSKRSAAVPVIAMPILTVAWTSGADELVGTGNGDGDGYAVGDGVSGGLSMGSALGEGSVGAGV